MKIQSAFAALLLLVSCAAPKDPTAFTLNANVEGLDGETLFIQYGQNDTTYISDSVVVADGKFVYEGKVEIPASQMMVSLGKLRAITRESKFSALWIAPGDISLTIDTSDWHKPVVTGSAPQLESEELANLGDKTFADFVKEHPDSYVAAYQMRFNVGRNSYEENLEIYNSFSENMKQNHEAIKELKAEIDVLAKVQPGAEAPDLVGPDLFGSASGEGKDIQFADTIRLSDYRGKVVLVDFWASWCKPCRASMPHVLECYKKYHDKGLEVFCVADNDSNPSQAIEAAREDGTTVFHHTKRGLVFNGRKADMSKDISKLYAVHYLPTKYLVDREGKIVGKIGDDAELDKALEELFK